MIGAVDSRPSPKETVMPFHVPLWLLGQCTPRVRDTLENDAGRRERLKPGAGLARYCSQAYFTQPSNLSEHLSDEAGNSACHYSLLLLITHVRTQKMSVGMGITGSLPLRDVTHSMNVLLLFAIVCLSALLSLSEEPSCLGRLIPTLSHKTVPVTAGLCCTDQSLASSTETSHLKRYGASAKADVDLSPCAAHPSGGAGTANWGWFVLVQTAILLYFPFKSD